MDLGDIDHQPRPVEAMAGRSVGNAAAPVGQLTRTAGLCHDRVASGSSRRLQLFGRVRSGVTRIDPPAPLTRSRGMTDTPLQFLLAEAAELGGGNLCASGCDWRSVGGRACPRNLNEENCSQAVFQCSRCGTYDYGEPGGPGEESCFPCPHRVEAAA